jgi:hypothetical protein
MNDEEDYDVMRLRLENANEEILAAFINHTVGVRKKGKLKMHKHADLLRFFANDYLVNYEGEDLLEGLECFSSFVGDWFIRKCMWSDENAVRDNLQAFETFLTYLAETEQITPNRLAELNGFLSKDRDLYVLRAKYYNDPEIDLDDIINECGLWDDQAMLAFEQEVARLPLAPGQGRLTLNILLSSNASKFLKIKAPELVSLRAWGKSWDDPAHHWIANWRCEDCFGMKGSKERVFIVSNDASRYSFLLRLAPGDIKGFFTGLNQKLMAAIKANGASHPPTVQLQISTLSGAARSLISFQNNQRYYLDAIVHRGDYKYLEDSEERLNHIPTSTLNLNFPDLEFAHLCKEDPPFPVHLGDNKIIPFLN